MSKAKVILASGSPRRREILTQIGVDFRVVVSNDEECPKSANPLDFPRENAVAKALAVSKKEPGAYVLGFDTLVFLNGAPLGKPKDEKTPWKCSRNSTGKCTGSLRGLPSQKMAKSLMLNKKEQRCFFGRTPYRSSKIM